MGAKSVVADMKAALQNGWSGQDPLIVAVSTQDLSEIKNTINTNFVDTIIKQVTGKTIA